MGVCVEELVRVSEEEVLGLLDVPGFFGRGRFIAGISRRLSPELLDFWRVARWDPRLEKDEEWDGD